MKTIKFLAFAISVCTSLPLMMAQQVNSQAQDGASGSTAGAHVSQSANGDANANVNPGNAQAGGSAASSLTASSHGRDRASGNAEGNASGSAEMRPVTGELETKLDSKTAKPGDRVVLKTDKKIETADGTVIPKGSRLVGHVTEVQAHDKGHAMSQLGLAFDHAELKGGQTMAIQSTIESIQPSTYALAESSMAGEGALDTPMATGGGAMGGGGHVGGGGLLGGAANGAAMGTGRVGSDLSSTAGGAVRTTGNLSGDTSGSLARGVGGVTQGAGSLGARTTGFPGVMLNGDATGSASGMFSAANRNVHLDSGTQMVLGVAVAR